MATTAKSAPTSPPRLKPHELADLTTFCDIMHLIHHRNLNQHRHSIWWRSFSVFRRELSHFISEYTTYQPPAALSHSATSKPSAKASKVAARRAAARLCAWKKDAVPRWYLAFTDIISSTQFSAIGLVLLAILARVAQVTSITAAYEDEAELAMQALLRKFAEKDAKELFGAVEPGGMGPRNGGEEVVGEDVGEVIRRREDLGEVVNRALDEDRPQGSTDITPQPASKKKKGNKERKREDERRPSPALQTQPGAEAETGESTKKKKKKEKIVAESAAELESDVKEPPKKRKKTNKGKGSAIDDLFAGL